MGHKSTPSYLSPKLELRACPQKGGHGVFAKQALAAGELITVWGGEIVTAEELALLPLERQTHGIQVEENIYMVSLVDDDPSDFVNHSCDPNSGMSGQIALVALRDIAVDEEICFDYAMSDSSDYDEFECACGSPNCRKKITGNDWKKPELQKRYQGYFSPYLQHRIDRS
ncbi:MAG TPA: SET domain-containing protein-lysine N-methyltransferase [Anaerolineaceae bacterium]|nr:SET domain-containing protein-lysine N-methyltransferase [Anaerolineaceae bacterium]